MHQAAYETASRVDGQAQEPGPGRNHYRQTVILADGDRVEILLNAVNWLVACRRDGRPGAPFVEVPRPDLFELVGLHVATPQDLEQGGLLDNDTAGLSSSERADITYHRPTRVGDVLYNWFD